MKSEDFRAKRQEFKENALKDKAAFIAQGSRKCLVEMRYFRELCLREISWCRDWTKRKKTMIDVARRMKDAKKVRKLDGDILLMAEIVRIRRVQSARVSSVKIEGRKKSPLYVAAVTEYYRKLLGGRVFENTRQELENDIKTIYARPWTELYLQGRGNKDVADPDTTGHRGLEVGKIERLILPKGQPHKIRFRTSRALERHDGLQIELPGRERPYGFSVEFASKAKGGSIYSAPADSWVEVLLPKNHPKLPKESKIYCSSSQAVKRKILPLIKKPGKLKVRRKMDVRMTLSKYWMYLDPKVRREVVSETQYLIKKLRDELKKK